MDNRQPVPPHDAKLVPGGRTSWLWLFAYGVVLMIVGLLALANPLATGVASGLMLAVLLIVAGLASLLAFMRGAGWSNRWVDLIFGVLAIAAGIIATLSPLTGAMSLMMILGAWLFVSGLMELFAAITGATDRYWLGAIGLINVLAGGYLLFFADTQTALYTLTMLVGSLFILRGLLLTATSIIVRRVQIDRGEPR